MARILHLSDLHFGAHDPKLVEAVACRVDEEHPDLVVISGDFTQRARTEQFRDAGRFLTRLREAGQDALAAIAEAGVDLLLAGHNHLASTHASSLVHGAGRALIVQAGTATSTRVRGEGQSFNHIEVEANHVKVTIETWQDDRFARGDSQCFDRNGEHWDLDGGKPVNEVIEGVAQ